MQYYSRVHYYLYAYKQLYVISFLFFDNLAIVSRMILLFTASDNVICDNSSVCNRVYGYLRLSFMSTCVSYAFNILPLYFLFTCLLLLKYDWWYCHRHTIICRNTRSRKVACALLGCKGALLIKITIILMVFVFKYYRTGLLTENVALIEETQYL